MSKKILVAGGAGYIGTRLVQSLVRDGYDVTVVDLLWFGNNLPADIDVIRKDIFRLSEEELKGFDTVVFLAGLSNDPMAEYSPALNFISNAASPAYLAYLSKQAGVKRFVYGSSCSIYGFTDNEERTENSKVETDFPYGSSKLQGETGVEQFASDSFSVIALRQGTLSGYSPRMRFDLMINTMYMKAATEGQITVNNPVIWRPVLAMHDAIQAYTKAIAADGKISGVFNVASMNKQVGEVAEEIRDHFLNIHNQKVTIEEKQVEDKRNYRVSTQKSKDVLLIEFKGTVQTILDELDNNVGVDYDFINNKYYNIKVFKTLPRQILLD